MATSSYPYGVLAGPFVLTLTLNALTSTDSDDTSAACAIYVQRDGYVEELVNNTLPPVEQNPGVEWINDNSATIGDDYEARLEKTTGTDPVGIALDTWFTIDQEREWIWARAVVGTTAFTGTLFIREIADTGNSVSASVLIDCEVF